MRTLAVLLPLAALLSLFAAPARAEPPARIPVLLDTDAGDDIDDAFALALVLASPELDLRGVTTVDGDAHTRALLLCRFLHLVGRDDVPVASGKPPQETPAFAGQMQYGLRPRFKNRPEKEDAVEFLYRHLKEKPGELTLLAVGPLTNVAALFEKHPDCKPWVKRLVVMAGSVRVGYEDKSPPEPEWNVKSDVKAARAVFAGGVPLVVAPLDATATLKLDAPLRKKLLGAGTPLTRELAALYALWEKDTPVLFDPVAAALCFEEKFFTMEELRLEVDDSGLTKEVKGKANARVATAVQAGDFLSWYVERVSAGEAVTPAKAKPVNVSAPVERGSLPNRVHVAEDYETDVERRWWLCGRVETKEVPPGSTRACRGVPSNDFDEQQGDPKARYTAVVFNPVPGPPMGKDTRLSFRCRLKGADTLRVQIYSLSKGYHRCLTLTDLPQEKWQTLAVDVTAARRPDGSGGPLAEDERIDDVQFYADPAAELLIDDVLLYDAAAKGETRPFPRRVLFTGWFDTGKQGREWPGDFEIVPHQPPLTWKAAKAVVNPDTGEPWVRLSLRGERPLGDATSVRFRYRLAGADTMRVVLVNRTAKAEHVVVLKDLAKEKWAEAVVDFAGSTRADGREGKPRSGDKGDEVRFLVPKGADLLVDDVLLYEPGAAGKE
jgi:inosine-uridine nucleoside N-ribohydrolase